MYKHLFYHIMILYSCKEGEFSSFTIPKFSKLGRAILKLEIKAKVIVLFTLSIFWVIFETLKQLIRAFIHVPVSFIECTAYFKALIHFHKLQLGRLCLASNSFTVSFHFQAFFGFFIFLPFS